MNQIYIRGNEIATKAYVDGLSLGGDGSALENYYTKEEINNLIENNEGGNVDLSNYYTKEEINNVIAEINNTIQKETMPDPSEDNVGTIIQYIGDTNNTYTTGYFYQVIEETIINEDGTETIIYKWEEIKSPEIDLEKYATKEYVNEAIANLEGGNGSTSNPSDYATKEYVDKTIADSIADITTTSMEIVTTLPTESILTSTIYLIKDETASTDTENIYNEYIYVNGAWENIGSTKTTVDLSNYYTKEETEEKIIELISNREPSDDNQSSGDLSNYYTKEEIDNKGYITSSDANSTYVTQNNFNTLQQTVEDKANASDVYTKEEANKAITDAIADVKTTDFQTATTLPTENISTNTIYLISKEGVEGDVYEEYIYINNKWEKIGETTIDLSQYSTTEEMNAAIAAEIAKIDMSKYLTSTEASNTFATKTEVSNINNSINNMYSKTEVNTAIETAINNITHPEVDLSNYYNKQEIDDIIGDINAILDAINGEEV